jgi:hypothetical protein
MEEQINIHLSQAQTWKRIFFMLLFAVIVTLVRWLAWAVIVLQLIFVLITGEKNSNTLNFGRSLATYAYHILLFLTFSTEILPFPFSPWNMTAELKFPDEK